MKERPVLRAPLGVLVALVALLAAPAWGPAAAQPGRPGLPPEVPDDPYVAVPAAARVTAPPARVVRGGHLSIQVNTDSNGDNIVGDAANEPSIAVDPTDPSHIVIGWRQFDTVVSNFRQGGWAYTTDGGQSWTFPGVLETGVFRSDPVLDADAGGDIYYNSLEGDLTTDVFRSANGGASWGTPVFAFGGDKQWMAIDRTAGIGAGNVYQVWSTITGNNQFNRSTDGAGSFETPVPVPSRPIWGVIAVGPAGEVCVSGRSDSSSSQFILAKSTTLQDPGQSQAFDFAATVDLGGTQLVSTGPNPGGLLGQVWVATAPAVTPGGGTLYMLASVDPPGADPLDVHFVRSVDGGHTWSTPVRVNDDPGTAAWQWFGTMSVAPDGRIDAIWNDTRNAGGGFNSELYYAYSLDGGTTWSPNEPLSPSFNPQLGYPNQNKIGDYYDMVSDATGAHLAYTATFNGEQDVYYLHIPPPGEIFRDGFESGDTAAWSATVP